MDKERIYLALPISLQNLALQFEGMRIYRRRYAAGYDAIEKDVIRRSGLKGAAMASYRNRRLRELLIAATRAKFWRERFADYGVNAVAEDASVELAKLPVLGKAEVKIQVEGIVNSDFDRKKLVSRHTSGTTGGGLVFYETRDCERETWATWWRYRSWHALNRNTLCGYFGGRSVVPLTQKGPPFWRFNRVARQLMLSGYHLSPNTAAQYVQTLREYAVPWLHGYPSLLTLLAQYMLDQSLGELTAVRNITLGAESLSAWQTAKIQRAFPRALVAQHYGQAEAVANISQCRCGALHVDEDFSFVEFLPVEGVPGEYRIVGSNWINPAFALLRYDTGDVARLTERTCVCGSDWRIVESIDGRIEDVVILPSGARIGRTDHIFKDMTNIVEAQIRQSSTESIEIAVVRGVDYSDRDERALVEEARKRLGNEIKIGMRYLDSLPRTRAGKVRLVVSSLPSAQTN